MKAGRAKNQSSIYQIWFFLEPVCCKKRQKKVHDQSLHRGAFFQFLFRWIHYCHSSKSTGTETGKTHLCLLGQKFFVRFLGELKKPKCPFEINWLLAFLFHAYVFSRDVSLMHLINIWQMFNVATDSITAKLYILFKFVFQWICCKCLAW